MTRFLHGDRVVPHWGQTNFEVAFKFTTLLFSEILNSSFINDLSYVYRKYVSVYFEILGVSEFKCDFNKYLTPLGPLQSIAKLIQGGALKRAWRWRSGGIIFLFLTA